MLLFYFGEDYEKKHNKVQSVLKDIKKKQPEANFIHFDSFDINPENLKELLKSQGLFVEKNIVFLSNIFINKELKEWILKNIKEFQNSESAFIFSEEKITASEKKIIKENSLKFEEFKKPEFKENLFKISDFLLNKNKKNLWIFYQESLAKGNDADSIYNVIFWSLKTLALSEKISEQESGLKPFLYKKAKSALKNWKKDEPQEKLFKLLKIHSESRRGKINLKNSLEKFFLEL